ncbi:MAG: transposase [Anaerolineae bacterium]|nr:transposase [Anaerolineae bacterium]
MLYPHVECIELVLDNLNTHRYSVLLKSLASGRLLWNHAAYFITTPPHGSWLNMAEIEIGIMRHQCLRRRIPDEWTLGTELMAWELQANRACRKIHWSFTVDDARKVFAKNAR